MILSVYLIIYIYIYIYLFINTFDLYKHGFIVICHHGFLDQTRLPQVLSQMMMKPGVGGSQTLQNESGSRLTLALQESAGMFFVCIYISFPMLFYIYKWLFDTVSSYVYRYIYTYIFILVSSLYLNS